MRFIYFALATSAATLVTAAPFLDKLGEAIGEVIGGSGRVITNVGTSAWDGTKGLGNTVFVQPANSFANGVKSGYSGGTDKKSKSEEEKRKEEEWKRKYAETRQKELEEYNRQYSANLMQRDGQNNYQQQPIPHPQPNPSPNQLPTSSPYQQQHILGQMDPSYYQQPSIAATRQATPVF